MHRRGKGVEQAAQAQSGRGAGDEELCACGGGAAAQGRSVWSSGGEWARGGGARVRAAVREEEGSERETDSRGSQNG